MKLAEAQRIMAGPVPGYRVSFSWLERSVIASDYFPDRDEPAVATETEAWLLAKQFAVFTQGKYFDIYVVNSDYRPVAGYWEKRCSPRRVYAELKV